MEDIVSLLELFQGQLSLSDILNQDIPILNGLRQAKNKMNGLINSEREKAQQKVIQQQREMIQQNQKKK